MFGKTTTPGGLTVVAAVWAAPLLASLPEAKPWKR
jgi:hypothetical protein